MPASFGADETLAALQGRRGARVPETNCRKSQFGRTSPNSLYDEGIATMEGGGSYNQTDAEGFLRIQGLPGRVQAKVWPRKY